jgi:hypothetical protein
MVVMMTVINTGEEKVIASHRALLCPLTTPPPPSPLPILIQGKSLADPLRHRASYIALTNSHSSVSSSTLREQQTSSASSSSSAPSTQGTKPSKKKQGRKHGRESWKTKHVVFAGDFAKITEPGPPGPTHAWMEQSSPVDIGDLLNERLAALEWQAIIQNNTTVFEGLFCKPSDLQEVGLDGWPGLSSQPRR